MRYRALLLTSFLVLAACGGGGGNDTACKSDYWDGTYGTCLPGGWVVIESETLRQRGVPEDTIVAFQSEIPVSGQFPTITVTKEPLIDVVTPQTYSNASIRAVTVLPGYGEIDTRDILVAGEKVSLHIFKAQPSKDEPLRRFYQVSTVSDGVGYSITGTTPVALEDSLENQILLILRQSVFAEPTEGK